MFLSKLLLKPCCREAWRDLGAPYELHRTLARAFATEPGTDYRARHGVLFRIEPLAYAGDQPTVLVQSATEPNWHELPEAYLHSVRVNAFSPAFSSGQLLAFRVVANPTKKVTEYGQRQGRRVALLDASPTDELTPARAWLARKGEQHGFRVAYATSQDFWLGVGRGGRVAKSGLPLYGVRFDGLLEVTDPARFTDALQRGIGPAKAFGFGLLSVARTR